MVNEKLRNEYLKLLLKYGLEPRKRPPDAQKLWEKEFKHKLKQFEAAGNDLMADMLREQYQIFIEHSDNETRFPTVELIETIATEVEQSIQAINKYRDLLSKDIYVGEFPTGSINAQAKKVDSGFLVLINTGLLSSIIHVVEFLYAYKPDELTNSVTNRTTIDGIVAVLQAYLQYGDPSFGPKPDYLGGIDMLLSHVLVVSCLAFVIAHEYAHVIAGHLDADALLIEQLQTDVGSIEVIKKDWLQEFEADLIAYKIILGVDDYEQLDLTIIDQADYSEDPSVFKGAIKLQSAIVAPFIVLTIFSILDDVQNAVSSALDAKPSDNTHPPAKKRMVNFMPNIFRLTPKYAAFMFFHKVLVDHYDEICERLIRAMLEAKNGSTETP